MVVRSLLGVLLQGGFAYRARCCHTRGEPPHQVSQLATALHCFYHGDPKALLADILRWNWWMLAPVEAAREVTTGEYRNITGPPGLMPHAGIGYATSECSDDRSIAGAIDERPHATYGWLYLFNADGALRVFANETQRRWHAKYYFPTEELETFGTPASNCSDGTAS